jgi:hypothetical protein
MRKVFVAIMTQAAVVSLVVIATALTSERANSVTSVTTTRPATDVQVVNPSTAPVPTQATDNPALQPFQRRVNVTIPTAQSNAHVAGITVPAGQQLVIQTVSFYRYHGVVGSSVQVYIGTFTGNVQGIYALPSVGGDTGRIIPGATLSAVLYADPGTEVDVSSYRTTASTLTSSDEVDLVSISGYLVPVP